MRLLLVEDNQELANGLVRSLYQSGYITDVAHTGSQAITASRTTTYQLVILDLGLPDIDGMEVLRRMRKNGFVAPVLILTARDDLPDRIQGLDAGGDDYLTKPFELDELEARLRALLRRGSVAGSTLTLGNLQLDTLSHHAAIHGQDLDLTARELAVLNLLLRRPGRIVSKQELIDAMYPDSQETNPAVVEVLVSRLRRKFKDARADVAVRVLRGLGYRLEMIEDTPKPE